MSDEAPLPEPPMITTGSDYGGSSQGWDIENLSPADWLDKMADREFIERYWDQVPLWVREELETWDEAEDEDA